MARRSASSCWGSGPKSDSAARYDKPGPCPTPGPEPGLLPERWSMRPNDAGLRAITGTIDLDTL